MLPGECCDLVDLGFGNAVRIDAAQSNALVMYFEHYLSGLFAAFGKKLLQNHHNEFHGRVIVVQQQHLIQRWRFLSGCRAIYNGTFVSLRHSVFLL